MIFLTFDEIVKMNQKLTENFGGICGIRDKNLLESAIANPKNLFHYKNANVFEIASSYAFSIIKNHPFLDGNKRTGFSSMGLFLEINGIEISFPKKETVEIMVKIATSEIQIEQLASWLKNLTN